MSAVLVPSQEARDLVHAVACTGHAGDVSKLWTYIARLEAAVDTQQERVADLRGQLGQRRHA